ncbi:MULTISPECIES: TRAP transporter substrate-binding protein DctP [Roseobacteraceae]|uniref:ABC transporter substrate-binding protein n=1 Tax=Sulfitobacter pacificus TaxID=1499314 RepID=A0ABQ5VR58_9RHOB|nr:MULTISPECIES: TRAP transporter substrate-binding protein DctP [Roseobacteraceae]MDE4099471.1 TRAP transporter substrate-binding protein DctP [Phaeobacter gallaeciensis]MDE4108272.1 TRAP transporter substrate-binding protein DctP [Phaeobacter gallaeciensis]MDE4112976.1 TRAP transporter substrate-binding protein DctP [Phaeobacter gallaeciensis]MDE4117575.1 TRAP transporter substrate-binding protein DctP [Phaeobacter gallaeciensis]MDE4121919.1 TRAP transporter substrate-binding protein DctP [P
MKKQLCGLAASIALAPLATAAVADTKILASWDQSYAAVGEVLDPFMEYLEAETTAKLGLSRFGPETIPPFEQLNPVTQGLFDMLYTNGGYHYNDIALGMALDSLSGDIGTIHESGMWDFVDQEYQKAGLKLIAIFYDTNGFHMILKEPLTGDGLTGRRIRGTPLYHPVIEALGGSPVVLPGGDIYPALERGVVDGAAWPAVGAVNYRWFEVSSYFVRPTFGQVGHMLLMNLDAWNALDEQTRTEIETAARAYEVEASATFDGLAGTEEETLVAEGMQETRFEDDVVANLKSAWYNGVMDLAATVNPDEIAQMREIAETAGIGE